MRVWTRISVEQFQMLQEMGKLTADQANQIADSDDVLAYRWIGGELEKDVTRPEDCSYPVTVWYQAQGRKFVKGVRKSAEEAQEVLLTLDIPETDMKLFDGELFHYVEEGQYIPMDEADKARYETVLAHLGLKDDAEALEEACRQRRQDNVAEYLWRMMQDSWNSIFDTKREDGYLFGENSKKTIQAALWQIRMDQVKRVEYL